MQFIIAPIEAVLLLLGMGIAMFVVCKETRRVEKHADGFLVADRKVGVWRGALSIAVSWIWAPAIFICSMQAYTKGLPGIFWFTAPNIICFFVFTPIAIRMRRMMPRGYSFPDYIAEKRFPGEKRTHFAYLMVYFGYQLGALVINSLAGGYLLYSISGLNVNVAILLFAAIPLLYTLGTGLKASVITDAIQMVMVLGITFLLVPWCLIKLGGFHAVAAGIGGIDGSHSSLFDPWIAFAMGIPMTLGLISGPIGDQMFFQRAMATDERNIARTFIYGAFLFGIVPITLSLLGFMAVPLAKQGLLHVRDAQIVGLEVITFLLPKAAVYAFIFMAFAGLLSTIDSSMVAISSLATVDLYRRYHRPHASDSDLLRISRYSMILLAATGSAIALLQPKLLWVFLIYGALASAGLFPTVLALYWHRLTAGAAFWGITLSLAIGTPLSIYANIKDDPYLIVLAAVSSVTLSLLICLLLSWRREYHAAGG
jgi:urea-proton symporter